MRKKCTHHNESKRGPYPNPMRPRVDFKFKDEAAREKSLMRHPWYRKEKAWEAFRALLPARNRLDVA
jgi:hypothetical protein